MDFEKIIKGNFNMAALWPSHQEIELPFFLRIVSYLSSPLIAFLPGLRKSLIRLERSDVLRTFENF